MQISGCYTHNKLVLFAILDRNLVRDVSFRGRTVYAKFVFLFSRGSESFEEK